MTDGSRSHAAFMPEAELRARRELEAVEACRRLDVDERSIVFCRFPDQRLQTCRDAAIARVAEILHSRRPMEVAVPYRHDLTSDHVTTREIVRAAVRQRGLEVRVLEYPIWFWGAWPWTPVADQGRKHAAIAVLRGLLGAVRLLCQLRCQLSIENHLPVKRAALARHESQMTRLRSGALWPTLADVGGGDFLACFFRSHERFMVYFYGGSADAHLEPGR
jgi:LmbE family N-acetylglucosaminyl deacetylase